MQKTSAFGNPNILISLLRTNKRTITENIYELLRKKQLSYQNFMFLITPHTLEELKLVILQVVVGDKNRTRKMIRKTQVLHVFFGSSRSKREKFKID